MDVEGPYYKIALVTSMPIAAFIARLLQIILQENARRQQLDAGAVIWCLFAPALLLMVCGRMVALLRENQFLLVLAMCTVFALSFFMWSNLIPF